MELPKVDSKLEKIARTAVKKMVADAPYSATRGVYSIYGDFPSDPVLAGYFQRVYKQ